MWKKLKELLTKWTRPTGTQDADPAPVEDIGQRYREMFGEERMNLQLLYEHWAMKDSWHLRNEALPLLLGVDPGSYTRGGGLPEEQAINDLWQHARQCIEHKLLKVANPGQVEGDWRVDPLAIYHWAVLSRLQLPDPLVALMEFIARTVRQPVAVMPEDGNTSAELVNEREQVLGLALAVLAASPERCCNPQGQVTAEQLHNVLREHPAYGKHRPVQLGEGAIRGLLERWLNA